MTIDSRDGWNYVLGSQSVASRLNCQTELTWKGVQTVKQRIDHILFAGKRELATIGQDATVSSTYLARNAD